MTALLDVQNLIKHFPISGSAKRVQAVNGASFGIDPGQTLSLVGESGSGKTTVGRCVMGLIEPTSGTIVYEGRPLGPKHNVRSRALRGRIQCVFQEPFDSLNPRMQVGEALGEPLLYIGVSRPDREKRVLDIAKRIGLPRSHLEKLPAELSAGLQQRIGIGRAVITRPNLIVLDEPTSALDPTARAEIVDLLVRLQRELETAYLFISHDLSTVRFISDRLAVLYLGSIVELGDAKALFAQPRHPYTAGLMASVLLPHPSLRRSKVATLDGEIPSPVDLPPGCPLASRCIFVEPKCLQGPVAGFTPEPGHLVHCINHEKVAALASDTDYFDRFQDIANRVLSVGVTVLEGTARVES